MSRDLVRLNVNLNQETAAALRALMARHGITGTEAVRRSIGVLKYVSDQHDEGRKIQTMDRDGRNKLELELL